jgi:uncharacterized protein (TIGR02145 family)
METKFTTLYRRIDMKTTKRFLMAAGTSLALAFTFGGCGGGDDGADPDSGAEVSSSSVGGGGVTGNSSSSVTVEICDPETVVESKFTDSRDGKEYKAVKICSQTWMAENLNYEEENSLCNDKDPSYCDIYGRLYNWNTALTVCPDGWHLPSDEEWQTLVDFAGGASTAGRKLKATSGWNDYKNKSSNGTDEFGFAALPGGDGESDGRFGKVGDFGFWWSSKESALGAYYRFMGYNHEIEPDAIYRQSFPTDILFSVRCIKD